MKKKKVTAIVLAIVILAALATGMYVLYRHFSPKAQAGGKHITLRVVDDKGNRREYPLDTDAQYLLDAMLEVPELDIDGEESAEFGFTLYTVGGVTADFTNAYWAIYVGEDYGTYSVNQQPIEDGGQYTIQYETFQ